MPEAASTSRLRELEERAEREGAVSVDAAHALFDELPAVACEEMIGEWSGAVLATGHPGEAQLGALGWAGKTFRDEDDVDPIVCLDAGGERSANPVLGAASLRAVEHRGVVTATMVYDQHPVFDHFRRVDASTVLGLMDRKGEAAPLFFTLRRLSG